MWDWVRSVCLLLERRPSLERAGKLENEIRSEELDRADMGDVIERHYVRCLIRYTVSLLTSVHHK